MNKKFIAILLLLLLPSCAKKETIVSTHKKPQQPSIAQQPTQEAKPIFEEDVEGFELEEEGQPFTAPSEESEEEDIKIEEQDVQGESWQEKRLEDAQKYGFKTIYFNYDDYGIKADQKNVLEHNLKRVKDATNKGSTVVVEGHACRFAGSAVYNLHLSEDRARSVINYFVEHGVPAEKLKMVGRGHEMCIVPEGDMEQQAPNRRVEFYVLEKTEKV